RLTFAGSLANAIDYLLQKKATYGIYNASSDGAPASWANITRLIFKDLKRNDLTVTNTTTEEYFKTKPTGAPRPLQSELDLNKLKATGFMPRDWREELHEYIQAEQAHVS
ncbi:MAG TPA: sugar nucleotide-binding protein, partial [Candidatus Saccharimonadales bacterium]|nr:sugar nucleotide-binding protein [Candidatus Saccharimonadales bacterium]